MINGDVEQVLRMAGWAPGRSVADWVDSWASALRQQGGFILHDAARDFLEEFGGLAWPRRDPDEPISRFAFDLDPLLAVFEDDRFDEASTLVGQTLYPAGEAVNGHKFIAVGEAGTFFLVMDDVEECGRSCWEMFRQLLSVR